MTWTPPRKNQLPAHAKNTYKPKKKAENTYKKQPKTAVAGVNGKYLWLALAGGCALALLTSGSDSNATPAPGTGGSLPQPSPAPGTGGSTPQPSPAPTPMPAPSPAPQPTPTTRPPATQSRYVFVNDSWGESIYKQVSDTSSMVHGHGDGWITNLRDNTFIGLDTGHRKNGMMKLWIKLSNGIEYNYWIEAAKARILADKKAYDDFMATKGQRMSVLEESDIKLSFTIDKYI